MTASAARRGGRLARAATLAGGWTLLGAGAALLVLPGPGIPLVLGGLALLGREAGWARRLHGRVQAQAAAAARRLLRHGSSGP